MRTLIWFMFLMFFAAGAAAADIAMSATQQQNLGIRTAPLVAASGVSSQRYPAEVVLPVDQQRIVSAPQSGLIDMLYVAAGQTVKKGQPLARLVSPDLVGMQRDYLQAQTQEKLAAKTYQRDSELFREGIIAQRRFLESESAHEQAMASLAERRQALRLAGMGDGAIGKLTSPAAMGSGVVISAPIDGQVLEQTATVGQRVDASMPLYRIGRLSPLWVEIRAPVEQLQGMTTGLPVKLPKSNAGGKLIAIVRNVNKGDQTQLLRAAITQGAENLVPGQMVEAEIELAQGTASFTLPKAALVRSGADSWVFVKTPQGFRPSKVRLVSEQADQVVVSGNLRGDEQAAVSGTSAIKAAWLGLGGE